MSSIWDQVKKLLEARTIKNVDSWDGSPSRWDTTDDYCSACLIDVNPSGEDKRQTHCKLPVREPGDGKDVYVDKAVYAAAGGRGISAVTKPDDVSEETWTAAVKKAANKLISAYNQMEKTAPDSVYELAGKSPPESRAMSIGRVGRQVYEMIETKDPYAWINDIYVDGDGSLFLVISSQGKLYRANLTVSDEDVSVSDEWILVSEEFPPVTRTVHLEEGGKIRWVSITGTTVLNKLGVIDSRSLFDSFVTYAQQTEMYPYRTFYHQGEQFRTGQTDFVAREGNVYITSGVYDDNLLARAEIEAMRTSPEDWGESIGFKVTKESLVDIGEGIEILVYEEGINIEISTVLQTDAAHWFTAPTVMEVRSEMDNRVLAALRKLFGDDEEALQEFVAGVDGVNRSIAEDGLLTRDTEETQPPVLEIGDDVIQATITALQDTELIVSLTGELQEARSLIEGLAQQVIDLQNRLQVLETEETTRQDTWLADLGLARPTRVTYRPSNPPPKGEEEDPPMSMADRAAHNREGLQTY